MGDKVTNVTTVKQAEFARLSGVTRNTITEWKKRGWVVMDGNRVNVEASNVRLKRYRRNGLPGIDKGNGRRHETRGQAADRIAKDAAPFDIDEALRVKENYLALLNKLEYEKKSAAVVAVADVPGVWEELRTRVSERLLRIPREAARKAHQATTVAIAQDILAQTVRRALEDLTGCGPD